MRGYRNWRLRLEHELRRRFCLDIEDCLDEPLLMGFYHEGEDPGAVANWLKYKRDLTEYEGWETP